MSAHHLYIHVPFCTRKCSYCDFAIAVRRVVPVDDYLRGIASELSRLPTGAAGALETVYLGGGTPSRLGALGIARLLELVRERFDVTPDAEITIEANPEDISAESTAAWARAGINRLSIGIQSFDDDVLRWMHRVHNSADSVRAIGDARAGGIENLSVDLIFALPSQLSRAWQSDLERTLYLEPDHISLYGLTIEPATPIARWQERGEVVPANEDLYAEEFLLADEMASASGYRHYEVSNFARPGKESRHNSAYWSGASYLGVGPSAHSYDGESRTWNVAAYTEWLQRLDAGDATKRDEERLTADNRASERVYLGLRTAGGFHAAGSDLDKAKGWTSAGWASIEDDVVRLTPEGWLRLDSLAAGLTGF